MQEGHALMLGPFSREIVPPWPVIQRGRWRCAQALYNRRIVLCAVRVEAGQIHKEEGGRKKKEASSKGKKSRGDRTAGEWQNGGQTGQKGGTRVETGRDRDRTDKRKNVLR
jgi:hypothetical protein